MNVRVYFLAIMAVHLYLRVPLPTQQDHWYFPDIFSLPHSLLKVNVAH